MATQNLSLPYDTSTVANYKAIAQAFGTALAAFGWVNNSDTGSVNWANVTTLPGSTYRDWEVWKMGDALMSTHPVYMKLEYAQGGTNGFALRLTIGQGSNGSGTLTGVMTGGFSSMVVTAGQSSTGAANTWDCYFSGSSSRFSCLLWRGAVTTNPAVPLIFSIERSHNSSGADTDEYVTAIAAPNGGDWKPRQQSMMKPGIGGVTALETRLSGSVSSSGTGGFNNGVAVSAIRPWVGKEGNPLLGILVACNGDVAEGATVTASLYSATHTYIASKAGPNSGSGFANALGLGGNSTAMLMRYE